MNVARSKHGLKILRVVANLIRPMEELNHNVLEDQEILLKAADIALSNKVFLAFYEGLTKAKEDIPRRIYEIADRQLRKKKLYDKALTRIAEVVERRGMEFMVFKTVRPFTYIGDDIDVFLPTSNGFKLFIDLLKGQGYHIMGFGPPEATMVKKVSDVNIIVDVHRRFSASYIPYLDEMRVWEMRREHKFDGYTLHVPSLNDEMLILVGHSVLKEFRINLAEFYHAIFLLHKIDQDELHRLARAESMYFALLIFMSAAKYIYELLYFQRPPNVAVSNSSYLLRVADKILWTDFFHGMSMPYFYHLYLPSIAYLDKLWRNIFHGRVWDAYTFLISLLKAPFTNKEGINVLLNYLLRLVQK